MLRKLYLQQHITRTQYSTAKLYYQFRKYVLRSKSIKIPFQQASTNYKTKGIIHDFYASQILEHLWDQFELYMLQKDPNLSDLMDQITGFKEWGDISEDQVRWALKLIGKLFKTIDLPSVLREHGPKLEDKNQDVQRRFLSQANFRSTPSRHTPASLKKSQDYWGTSELGGR